MAIKIKAVARDIASIDALSRTSAEYGYSPYINKETRTWFAYDKINGWHDTGVDAHGEPGEAGYTPQKGVDYYDGTPGRDGYTPIKGVDYFDGKDGIDGKDGADGKDGYTPIKGVDYYDGAPGKDGYTPVKGIDYFDGAPGRDGDVGEPGKSPIRLPNGNWADWDWETESYIDSGQPSRGENGKQGEPGKDGEVPQAMIEEWDGRIADAEAAALDAVSTANAAESIARGKATGYVFDTEDDMQEWLSDSGNVAKLNVGDNLYIIATDVPDRWWDGTQAQPLEGEKPDFSDYVKKTDYATSDTGGVVKTGNGLYVTAAGVLSGNSYSLDTYNSLSVRTVLSKGTLDNIFLDKLKSQSDFINELIDAKLGVVADGAY